MALTQRILAGGSRSLVRLLFILVLVGLGAYLLYIKAGDLLRDIYNLVSKEPASASTIISLSRAQNVIPMAVLGAILGGLVANGLLKLWDNSARKWDRMDTGDKVTLFLGI